MKMRAVEDFKATLERPNSSPTAGSYVISKFNSPSTLLWKASYSVERVRLRISIANVIATSLLGIGVGHRSIGYCMWDMNIDD